MSTLKYKINMEKEVWKPVKEYEGLYEVSSFGRIKSFYGYYSGGYGRILKPILNKKDPDYYRIGLNKNGIATKLLVHRIVACNFIENPLNLPCVNHKNFNRLDNSVKNLEWVTYQENNDHAKLGGKYKTGEDHGASILTQDQVNNIRWLFLSKTPPPEICNLYNISNSTFYHITNNETWKDEEYDLIIKSKFFKASERLKTNGGDKNKNSKLNDEKVLTIRVLYEYYGFSSVKLANLFDVEKPTILAILNKDTWKHI